MGFVKVVKNKAYFKRYQVKFKRRRQCRTDYVARTAMITQDKNKYKTPKYRFVVRITNKDVICQIFSSDLTHDVCLASAYSHELQRYGLSLGLTNYAAAYCTGLLLARRINVKFGLDKEYEGNTTVDGADYNVEAGPGRRPFKALLDVGLTRTTTGARIFGALKGACDGGVDVPHKDRRFPGSKREEGEWVADPDIHRKYIFGQHVAEYMTKLQSEDEEAYNRHFKRFVDAEISADDLETLYTDVHKKIRENPNIKRDGLEKGYFHKRETPRQEKVETKRWRRVALSLQQRKDRIRQKLTNLGVKSIKDEIAAGVAKPRAAAATDAAAAEDAEDGGGDEAEAGGDDGGEGEAETDVV
jgi:large subunit ribosomal protein L5e